MPCEQHPNIKKEIKLPHNLDDSSEEEREAHYWECDECESVYDVILHAAVYCPECLTTLSGDLEVDTEIEKFKKYFGSIFETEIEMMKKAGTF